MHGPGAAWKQANHGAPSCRAYRQKPARTLAQPGHRLGGQGGVALGLELGDVGRAVAQDGTLAVQADDAPQFGSG